MTPRKVRFLTCVRNDKRGNEKGKLMAKLLIKLGLIMNYESKRNWSVIINALLTALTGLLTGFGFLN